MSRRVDDDLLKHDAGIDQPELEHMLARLRERVRVVMITMLSATLFSHALRASCPPVTSTICGVSSSNDTA